MKKLSVCLMIALSIQLSGCKDKPANPVEENEIPETLEPLKPLADADLVSLSSEFETYLIKEKIDRETKPDGNIRYGDIKNVDSLNIFLLGGNKNLKGLEYFTNLRYLKFEAYQIPTDITNNYSYAFPVGVVKEFKPPLDTLDVRHNLNLEYLDVSGRSDGGGHRASIGFLKLGKNEKLKTLISQFGMMDKIDLSGLSNLENLDIVESYSLKTVSLCNNSRLKDLRSWQVEKFYVADPSKVDSSWPGQTGGAVFLKCQ